MAEWYQHLHACHGGWQSLDCVRTPIQMLFQRCVAVFFHLLFFLSDSSFQTVGSLICCSHDDRQAQMSLRGSKAKISNQNLFQRPSAEKKGKKSFYTTTDISRAVLTAQFWDRHPFFWPIQSDVSTQLTAKLVHPIASARTILHYCHTENK